ncbi:MAG: glutamate racemase [Deltaproteobacteria bacterium]|nr:glutamate racemase [Deltaproteobacteria bacterium]
MPKERAAKARDLREVQSYIGVFDSGVGGLTVLKELKRSLPNESFVYLGDTARTPYGSRADETIIRYSLECANFLTNNFNVKLAVIACNTASAVAEARVKAESRCPVIGTIQQAAALAAESTRIGKIGVIGTEATIASGVYQKELKKLDSSLKIISKACPLFVPLVEQGMFSGEIVDKVVEYYLASLRDHGIDTLVLGCTHYPILREAIDRFFSRNIAIVECSKAIALEARRLLTEKNGLSAHSANGLSRFEDLFYVTDGSERFDTMAALFLQNGSVRSIRVEDLNLKLPARFKPKRRAAGS